MDYSHSRIEDRFRADRSEIARKFSARNIVQTCFTRTRAYAIRRHSRMHCRVSVNMEDTYAHTTIRNVITNCIRSPRETRKHGIAIPLMQPRVLKLSLFSSSRLLLSPVRLIIEFSACELLIRTSFQLSSECFSSSR